MAQPLVTIITLCWNKHHLIEGFLYSLSRVLNPKSSMITELIIVDNGSRDITPDIIINWQMKGPLPEYRQAIMHTSNLGFSVGNNRGIQQAKGEYILLVNNDVVFHEDPIEECLRYYQKDSLVGPRLLTHDTGWNMLHGKPVPYLEGWALFFHKDILDKIGVAVLNDDDESDVGIFDERFSPAFYEDVDLGLRAKLAGVKLVSAPISIRHLGSQTSFKTPGFYPLPTTHANRTKFLDKWKYLSEEEMKCLSVGRNEMPKCRMSGSATLYMKKLLRGYIDKRTKKTAGWAFGIREILIDFEQDEQENLFTDVDYDKVASWISLLVEDGFLEKVATGKYRKVA